MADKKQLDLVRALHAKTMDDKVIWEVTSEDEVFQAPFVNYSILLRKVGADYVIEVMNSEGDVVDSFVDTDFEGYGGSPTAFGMMQQTYNRARQIALGTSKALDDLLGQIDQL